MSKKTIVYLTGTRADYGKMKYLLKHLDSLPGLDVHIFVTGMHMLPHFGLTASEVRKDDHRNIHEYMNQKMGDTMEHVLEQTMVGFADLVSQVQPDAIMLHGDRVETLAGAMVAHDHSIPVIHFEGGEVSGTVDEQIRHATTLLSDLHFVANDQAAKRVQKLIGDTTSIFPFGSPEVDQIGNLDSMGLKEAKDHYQIEFDKYAIGILHPVTTEQRDAAKQADIFKEALLASNKNYILIYPNNDPGGQEICESLLELEKHPKFRIFPSIRFEHFRTLLSNAEFMIGNSSAGVREAPTFGIPSIDIGSRQSGRTDSQLVTHCKFDERVILSAINRVCEVVGKEPEYHFGKGNIVENITNTISKFLVMRISRF